MGLALRPASELMKTKVPARRARIACKYVASTYANEVITTHGVVREKTPKGAGFRFKLEVWTDNEAGEIKTTGWVEADVGV